jgi:ATP-dependent DNA helicase RecG
MSKEEGQNTEWKTSWRDEYLKWLCGFANAEGGVLVIGRSDKGKAVGVADAKKLLVDLPNKIRDVLGIVADVRLVKDHGKELVEIRVEPYPNPISYKGEYHVRSGSTKQELKGAALDRFLLRRYGRTWDSVPVPGVTVRQLSATAFSTFRKLARQSERMTAADLKGSRENLLEKLRLIEGKYLTHAAVLLFHPEPQRIFTGAYVKIGFFRNGSDVVYHDLIEGDLFTQAAETVELIRAKYMKAAITYEGIHRVETYPVPYEALREAVLNAIIHKDYAAHTPIQIKVYEDKMSIWNPGHLPENWTPEKVMQQHSSIPFNPEIANAFFRSGEIEMWGRGIERIVEECRAAGFPDPVIKYDAGDWWTEFSYPKSVLERLDGEPAESGEPKTRVNSKGKTLVETPVKTPVKILAVLKDHPEYSLAEVAAAIGKSLSAVERAAAKLGKSGKLRRIGPAKGGHWEIVE